MRHLCCTFSRVIVDAFLFPPNVRLRSDERITPEAWMRHNWTMALAIPLYRPMRRATLDDLDSQSTGLPVDPNPRRRPLANLYISIEPAYPLTPPLQPRLPPRAGPHPS